MSAVSAWLQRFAPRSGARRRLYCFHHAGVGAAVFRPWALAAVPDLEVVAIQLPGRGTRMGEPSLERVEEMVEGVTCALHDQLDLPFAFFGHSMGSLVALETARSLASRGWKQPEHLFVSGRRPPHVPDPQPPLDGLDDAAFVAEINRRYGGIPAEILEHAELLALLLPTLRADIRALERHGVRTVDALDCPLTAYGGVQDALTPLEHLQAWRPLTRAAFRLRQFPGGHFYVDAQRAGLLADITQVLDFTATEAAR